MRYIVWGANQFGNEFCEKAILYFNIDYVIDNFIGGGMELSDRKLDIYKPERLLQENKSHIRILIYALRRNSYSEISTLLDQMGFSEDINYFDATVSRNLQEYFLFWKYGVTNGKRLLPEYDMSVILDNIKAVDYSQYIAMKRIFYSAQDLYRKVIAVIVPLIKKEFSIVDLGAGKGNYSYMLSKTGFNLKITAVEASDFNMMILNSLSNTIQDIVPKKGDIRELDFKDNSFDISFCSCVLEFIEKGWEQAVLEMLRITKPNGFCVVIFGNTMHNGMREKYEKVNRPLSTINIETLEHIMSNRAKRIYIESIFSTDSEQSFPKNSYSPYLYIVVYQKINSDM